MGTASKNDAPEPGDVVQCHFEHNIFITNTALRNAGLPTSLSAFNAHDVRHGEIGIIISIVPVRYIGCSGFITFMMLKDGNIYPDFFNYHSKVTKQYVFSDFWMIIP